MGRAEDLFRRLIEGGEAVVDEMIVERQTEELFLDFKRSADSAGGTSLRFGANRGADHSLINLGGLRGARSGVSGATDQER